MSLHASVRASPPSSFPKHLCHQGSAPGPDTHAPSHPPRTKPLRPLSDPLQEELQPGDTASGSISSSISKECEREEPVPTGRLPAVCAQWVCLVCLCEIVALPYPEQHARRCRKPQTRRKCSLEGGPLWIRLVHQGPQPRAPELRVLGVPTRPREAPAIL